MTKYQFDLPEDFKKYLGVYKSIHNLKTLNDALIEIVRDNIKNDNKFKEFDMKKKEKV
jgi:SMC interacting uncharacterized protein involved in chromosome segregation